MIVCDYCKAKKDTLNFCSTKHRVYYHRGGAKKHQTIDMVGKIVEKPTEKTDLYGNCKNCGNARTLHGTRFIKCKEFV
jgi:ribosomal protein L44E